MTELTGKDRRWINLIKEQLDKIKFGSVKIEITKQNGKVVHAKIINEESIRLQALTSTNPSDIIQGRSNTIDVKNLWLDRAMQRKNLAEMRGFYFFKKYICLKVLKIFLGYLKRK